MFLELAHGVVNHNSFVVPFDDAGFVHVPEALPGAVLAREVVGAVLVGRVLGVAVGKHVNGHDICTEKEEGHDKKELIGHLDQEKAQRFKCSSY